MGGFYEVAFKRECRRILEDQEQLPIGVGDFVVVETERGEDVGRVLQKGELAALKGKDREVSRVVRRATPDDLERLRERRQREAEALVVCREKAAQHKLNMKTLDVEYEPDGSRVTFYFTANGRIDFRELVRDLARTYRTRIELRQIGFRVETKRMGGYGICGRSLCCSAFIQKPSPVPIQAARDPAHSQNVSKLTGVCGQLKCCLVFEHASGAGCAPCCQRGATAAGGDGVLHEILQAQDEEEGLEELPLVEAQGAQAYELEVR